MKNTFLIIGLIFIFSASVFAQTDTTAADTARVKVKKLSGKKKKEPKEKKVKKADRIVEEQQADVPADTSKKTILFRANIGDSTNITNQDAIYNRPFISFGRSKTAIGGYIEGNTNYFAEDGVSEGFSMELRRFNIFLYSSISQRIRFLSELEFEHGTEEIAIETAQIDFEVNTALNFRGGIILPQIGLVNANHDSPNWEFIDRPLSSTQIIPTTLSEVGFGLHGKFFFSDNIVSYNAYVVNGLSENIILNEEGKTFIPAGKSEEMFGEDNNGEPMYNARVAITNRKAGEVGVSYYGGVYNKYQIEGEEVEKKQRLDMFAVDFSAQLYEATVQGEYVFAKIGIPGNLEELYGGRQNGGFIEIIYPFYEMKVLNYENAKFLASFRAENIDYNEGRFAATAQEIGDEVVALVGGLSFRPTASTVFKANYRYQWNYDFLGNPPSILGGFQVGFATYF
ncbi:MAG: hypothetical protein COA57_13080 [Flavobacteriales bacterium]|nr:MAG: hypothetical protein COA57_13080 [Flavobacteriales bacterium]